MTKKQEQDRQREIEEERARVVAEAIASVQIFLGKSVAPKRRR